MKRGPRETGSLVRALLRTLLPAEDREFYLGDLAESGRRPGLGDMVAAIGMRVSRWRGARTSSGRITNLLNALRTDLRLGIRRLLRQPASTLTAISALALGIGMSALMFSLIRSGLLPTLPFEAGDRIVRIQRLAHAPIDAAAYENWRDRQRSFEGVGGGTVRVANLGIEGGATAPVNRAAIDVTAFALIGVRPVLGRPFAEADASPGAPEVVLIGWTVWRTRMDGDPDVVGRMVRVNGTPATVIGVMPEGFAFPWREEVWQPLRLDALRPERGEGGLWMFGLLREGVSFEDAVAELNDLERALPRAATESGPVPVEVSGFTDIINPRGRSHQIAAAMLAVALMVLLVACANATNVLLAQAVVRRREVAVRAALGASRLRLAMQILAEVALLTLAGAIGGVVVALFGLRAVRNAISPDLGMPFWFDLRVDAGVLAFVAIAAALAAMVAGVAPALDAAKVDRGDVLKDGMRGASRRLTGVMGRLIGAELAVSFVFLVVAGLFIRSAVNVQKTRYPFEPETVYTGTVRVPDDRYEDAALRAALIERVRERLAAIAGTSGAGITTSLPAIDAGRGSSVAFEEVRVPAARLPATRRIATSPGFFGLFRTEVLSGRDFDARDRGVAAPVAIVNRAFEERFLPAGAVGRRIALSAGSGEPEWRTIVGVVADLMPGGLEEPGADAVYVPVAQEAPWSFRVAVRSNGPPLALADPVQAAIADVDPDLTFSWGHPLDRSIAMANGALAWVSALFLIAGAIALFLGAIGLYGVLAFWVAQRTREIGVRMAVGGGRASIVGLVLRQAMRQVVTGILFGLVIAAPLAWLMRSMLFGVQPFDPVVFGAVLGVLLAAGSIGCTLPALRATRVDPQTALAAE